MGGGGGSSRQTYPQAGVSFDNQINLSSPHTMDLSRKYVLDNSAADKKVVDAVNKSANDKPFTIGKDTIPHPAFTNSDPNIDTDIITEYKNRGSYRNWFKENTRLNPGFSIHQLEDRVMDKKTGKPLHFDMLPEVKELQYRFSLLPLANTSRNDKEFKTSKKKLNSRDRHIERLHHLSSFKLVSKSNMSREYDRTVIDPHSHIHENIVDSIINKTKQNETLEEHVNGIGKAFHSLMDKFESGEYTRHPNFWSGHLFAQGNDRNKIWKNIGTRLTTQDEFFQKANK